MQFRKTEKRDKKSGTNCPKFELPNNPRGDVQLLLLL